MGASGRPRKPEWLAEKGSRLPAAGHLRREGLGLRCLWQ